MKLFFLLPSAFFLLFTLIPNPTSALPLSTSGRWIVDQSGRRVKLACVNWPTHLEPMVAEGLNKRPLDEISKSIVSTGFNCVRLTWPLYLVTNPSLATVTVRQSFQRLGLNAVIAGLVKNNGWVLDQTLIQAFKAVVSNLGCNKIMVILDNHITKPGWCCSNHDGNSFFWDKFFNPNEWIAGLTKMAKIFNGFNNVIGMSLRNELRGQKQNVLGWYKYMQMGAEAVHKVNPNVLVILSGLNYDTDLSFLSEQKFLLSFTNKLVHEMHWYGFTDGNTWDWNTNDACVFVTSSVMRRAGFLLSQGLPLFMSEWGLDQRGENKKDNRFLGCFLAAAAELDVDWGLWGLQGSYYIREGAVDVEEVYGALNFDWSRPRNPHFIHRIAFVQSPLQGPGLNHTPHTILYHPASGLCVGLLKSLLRLGPCDSARGWRYTEQKAIQLQGSNLYLKESGAGQEVKLIKDNNDGSLKWDIISASRMHISSRSGTNLCLDIGYKRQYPCNKSM